MNTDRLRSVEELNKLEQFFCKASLATWVGGAEAKSDLQYPYSEIFQYQEYPNKEGKGFRYEDRFYGPHDRSFAGTTIVWQDDIPVFYYTYQGEVFDPTVDPTVVYRSLKIVLSKMYREGMFLGGRGPEYTIEDGYIYQNIPDYGVVNASMRWCSGCEIMKPVFQMELQEIEGEMVASLKEVVYRLHYQGMTLVPYER